MLLQSQFICTSAVRSDLFVLRCDQMDQFYQTSSQPSSNVKPTFPTLPRVACYCSIWFKHRRTSFQMLLLSTSFHLFMIYFFINLKWFFCYGYYSLKHLLSNCSFWLPLHLSMFYFIVFKSLGSSWNLSHSTLNVLWLW